MINCIHTVYTITIMDSFGDIDVSEQIMLRLPFPDVINLNRTNKVFNSIYHMNSFWVAYIKRWYLLDYTKFSGTYSPYEMAQNTYKLLLDATLIPINSLELYFISNMNTSFFHVVSGFKNYLHPEDPDLNKFLQEFVDQNFQCITVSNIITKKNKYLHKTGITELTFDSKLAHGLIKYIETSFDRGEFRAYCFGFVTGFFYNNLTQAMNQIYSHMYDNSWSPQLIDIRVNKT